jgi:regulator of nonsense transcripts 2
VANLSSALSSPSRPSLAALAPEQREKEDTARVTRQRPVIRVCSELALVGIIKDASDRSGAEWMMKAIKELVSSNYRIVLQSLNIRISCLTIQVYLLCHY